MFLREPQSPKTTVKVTVTTPRVSLFCRPRLSVRTMDLGPEPGLAFGIMTAPRGSAMVGSSQVSPRHPHACFARGLVGGGGGPTDLAVPVMPLRKGYESTAPFSLAVYVVFCCHTPTKLINI